MVNGVVFHPSAEISDTGGITVWEGIEPDSVYINAQVKNTTDVERSYDVAIEVDGEFVDLVGGTVGPQSEDGVDSTITDLGVGPGETQEFEVCVQLVNVSPV